MPFMIPIYTDEPFHVADNKYREREAIPADVFGTLDAFMDEIGTRDENRADGETVTGKWWCQLSAPGYMDATDWDGPYDTLDEARDAIRDTYDVDPDTGNDLTDETEES